MFKASKLLDLQVDQGMIEMGSGVRLSPLRLHKTTKPGFQPGFVVLVQAWTLDRAGEYRAVGTELRQIEKIKAIF